MMNNNRFNIYRDNPLSHRNQTMTLDTMSFYKNSVMNLSCNIVMNFNIGVPFNSKDINYRKLIYKSLLRASKYKHDNRRSLYMKYPMKKSLICESEFGWDKYTLN